MAQDNGLGALFRDYGEEYIRIYKPPEQHIKLIRSIRVCKTVALGGKAYRCLVCGKMKYVYYSCGNSRCPKCQGIKRMQWQDRISGMLYRCPYVHMVFTMPRELHRMSRHNPSLIYNCLMRSAWSSLKHCSADPNNLGALPGAIMVLHTFGSDLKYHVHVHALVTFGGMTHQGQWKWPKRRRKIVPYRELRRTFRKHFLEYLSGIYHQLETNSSYLNLEKELSSKSWCVHAEPPTMDSDRIKEYLGKYISRIGLSKRRFNYDHIKKEVTLKFRDYKNKDQQTQIAPIATKILHPLVAINQILQHALPRYFQKCRYVGLHANACRKKYENNLPKSIKNNNHTIRTVFQLIQTMLGIETLNCDHCSHDTFDVQPIPQNREWIKTWLKLPIHNRGSPKKPSYHPYNRTLPHGKPGSSCLESRKLALFH